MHLCIFASLLSISLKAQTIEPSCSTLDSTATFEQLINCILSIDKSPARIPSRFLLEQGYNISKIEKLQGFCTDSNHTNLQDFLLNYYSIRSSYLGGLNLSDIGDNGLPASPKPIPIYHLPTPERMENAINAIGLSSPNRIKIPMFLIKYAHFREDALSLEYVKVT